MLFFLFAFFFVYEKIVILAYTINVKIDFLKKYHAYIFTFKNIFNTMLIYINYFKIFTLINQYIDIF